AQAIRAELREHDAVNIDCWRAFDSVHFAVFDVTSNIGIVLVGVELRIESLAIEPHLGRILLQGIRIESALVFEQEVNVFPEFSLSVCGLSHTSYLQGVCVELLQRKVMNDNMYASTVR